MGVLEDLYVGDARELARLFYGPIRKQKGDGRAARTSSAAELTEIQLAAVEAAEAFLAGRAEPVRPSIDTAYITDAALAHVLVKGLTIGSSRRKKDGSWSRLPSNLDLLTARVAHSTGRSHPRSFRAAARKLLPGRRSREHGAYLVAPEWVRMFASLRRSQIDAIVDGWAKDIEKNDPGFLEGTGEPLWLFSKLEGIVMACRLAVRTKESAVYTWSL